MKLNSMQELYIDELRDIYNAEERILEALPKMAGATKHPELRNAFNEHFQITKRQVERLDRIFNMMQEKATGRKCKGMKGILDEGEEIIKNTKDPDVRDVALISAAQRVEHYEMAAYGTLRTYASLLGFNEHVELLQQILNEEGETDHKLTSLAEKTINIEAVH